jgi:argininosuccinate lyase
VARGRAAVLPLGSGALAGTPLPIDREALARDLGFAASSPNALDAVMDRDFAAEFAFACAQLQTHLARLSEDLIHFAGPEHGLLGLPDAYTTGSSLMPQKKNPDALELVRGKAARVDADVLRLLALMKGLPAGYQKDLQEDKEAVFDAADTAELSLEVMAGVVSGLELRRDAMARAAAAPELMAAGLAVALACDGMPFRKAHGLVGSLVAEAQGSGRGLVETARATLLAAAPMIAARLDALFDPAAAVRAKAAPGGTAPDAVRASLEAARAAVS